MQDSRTKSRPRWGRGTRRGEGVLDVQTRSCSLFDAINLEHTAVGRPHAFSVNGRLSAASCCFDEDPFPHHRWAPFPTEDGISLHPVPQLNASLSLRSQRGCKTACGGCFCGESRRWQLRGGRLPGPAGPLRRQATLYPRRRRTAREQTSDGTKRTKSPHCWGGGPSMMAGGVLVEAA